MFKQIQLIIAALLLCSFAFSLRAKADEIQPIPALREQINNKAPATTAPAGLPPMEIAPRGLPPTEIVPTGLAPTGTRLAPTGTKRLPATGLSPAVGTPGTDNSVASFFQLPPSQPANQTTSGASKKASVRRMVWHVMDNMGVPMIVGKDNDMDPSINRADGMPPIQVPTMAGFKKMDKQIKHNEETANEPATANAVPNGNAALHKIPQSELEGVELPAPRDESGR
jgi:hypothetical protein